MKKMLTFMLLICAALSANAQWAGQYTGDLYIGGTAEEGEEPTINNILIFGGSEANLINFVLPNFSFADINLGDIVLIDVPVTSAGALSVTGYPLYLPALETRVAIDIVSGSAFSGNSLNITLAIDVPGLFTVPVYFQNGVKQTSDQYHIRNGNFEQWESNGYEPVNWNTFNTATGGYSSTVSGKASSQMAKVTPGRDGSGSCVLVKSRFLVVAKANGNLTTGCINTASYAASDGSKNYNYTNASDSDYNLPIIGHPESLSYWMKFSGANGANDTTHAQVTAILHSKGNYQDPATTTAHTNMEVATARLASKETEWTQKSVAFNYTNAAQTDANDSVPAFLLIDITTCRTPGGGNTTSSSVDQLWIDDIKLVYNSELSTMTYNGADVNFVDGKAELDMLYDDENAIINTTLANKWTNSYIGFDPINYTVTVIVKGEDFLQDPTSFHTYTLQLQKPTYSRVVEENAFGTICLPYAVDTTAQQGADFYEIAQVHKTSDGNLSALSLVQVNGALQAGKPYFFQATADTLTVGFSGTKATTCVAANGLIGNLGANTTLSGNDNIYVLGADNKLHHLSSAYTITFPQYMAYFDASAEVAQIAPAPGSKVITIGNADATVTDIDNAETQKPTKFIQDGALYIRTAQGVFDIFGRKVK